MIFLSSIFCFPFATAACMPAAACLAPSCSDSCSNACLPDLFHQSINRSINPSIHQSINPSIHPIKNRRRILGGGQGSSWNTRPKPSLLADVSAAFAHTSMTVSVPVWFEGKGWRRGLFSKFTFAEVLVTLATSSARKNKPSYKNGGLGNRLRKEPHPRTDTHMISLSSIFCFPFATAAWLLRCTFMKLENLMQTAPSINPSIHPINQSIYPSIHQSINQWREPPRSTPAV